MHKLWLFILLTLLLSACRLPEGAPQAQLPSALTSLPPAADSITNAPTPPATKPAPTPIAASQPPPSDLYDRIPPQFTAFQEPRQTPSCVHAAVPPLDPSASRLSLDRLKNAEYLSSSGFNRIRLVDGKYLDPVLAHMTINDMSLSDSDRERLGTQLLEPVSYGDVDGNGTEDAIVVLGTWAGGTGFGRDVVIVLNEDGTPTSVANIYFGDRDVVNSVTVVQDDIVIDATMHWPATRERKAFRLCNGTMVLVDEPPR